MSKKRRASLKWPTQKALVRTLVRSLDLRERPREQDGLLSAGSTADLVANGASFFAPFTNARADAFHQAPIALVILDPQGNVLDSNETASVLLGISHESLRGRRFLDFLPIPREREEAKRLLELCGRNAAPAKLDVSFTQSSHKRVRIELSVSCSIAQHSGELLYFIALIDGTTAHRTRSELQQEIQALRTQLDIRTAEQRRLKEELGEVHRQRELLEMEVIETSEREKRKFGQHLHDETCQSLTGLSFLATVLARKLADQPETHAALEDLATELKKVVEKTRNISWTLDPVILNGGLIPALRLLVRQTEDKVPCKLSAPEELQLSEPISLALFRIAKEAVQNAVRHAGASMIKIAVGRSRQRFVLTVEDNGSGIRFLDSRDDGALGIHMMRYRARSIGAELTIENVAPTGTKVCCVLPSACNGHLL